MLSLFPFLAFAALALAPSVFPMDTEEDDAVDDMDMGDDAGDDTADDAGDDAGDDTGDDTGDDAGDDTGDDPDPEPAGSITVTITDAEGEERLVELEDVNSDTPIDIDGSDIRDVFEASLEPTLDVQLNGLGGDDALSFGFGTSADGGEGSDVLELTLTEAALAAGALEAGTVFLSDTDDALAIEVEEGVEGFVHEIRITSSTDPEENTTVETVTLYYVLSASETLTIDEEASALAGAPVFAEEGQVLTEIDLGSETTTVTEDETGAPVETVTGEINDDPTIVLNRDVTTTTEI